MCCNADMLTATLVCFTLSFFSQWVALRCDGVSNFIYGSFSFDSYIYNIYVQSVDSSSEHVCLYIQLINKCARRLMVFYVYYARMLNTH